MAVTQEHPKLSTPHGFAPRIATIPVVVITIIAIVSGGVFALRNEIWQKYQIDHRWCHDQAASAQPLLDALDEYRSQFGTYPAQLDGLVPTFIDQVPAPTLHPSGNSGEKWIYRRLSGNRFQLSVTALHWVSTFDALVYRSSQEYPELWTRDHCTQDFAGWLYVVGAQDLKPSVVAPNHRQ